MCLFALDGSRCLHAQNTIALMVLSWHSTYNSECGSECAFLESRRPHSRAVPRRTVTCSFLAAGSLFKHPPLLRATCLVSCQIKVSCMSCLARDICRDRTADVKPPTNPPTQKQAEAAKTGGLTSRFRRLQFLVSLHAQRQRKKLRHANLMLFVSITVCLEAGLVLRLFVWALHPAVVAGVVWFMKALAL